MEEKEIDKKLMENPYDFICDFYENLYMHMGDRVMRILSLVPCSQVMPPFFDKNTGKITSPRINFLLLALPGTAKTAISNHFKKICFEPFPFEYITDSKLSSVLDEKEYVTVITSDISRIFRDPILSKLIENIVGDEGKLSRFTQKSIDKEEKEINAVGYFSGTPQNLNKTITDGLVFRVSPCIIFHTEKEHEEILRRVNDRIASGNGDESFNIEDKIKKYYIKVAEKAKEITNFYEIPAYFREEIQNKLLPLFRKPFKETEFEYVRELNQTYRYMVAHSVLNIFNRKIVDGKLIIEDKDLRVAMNLTDKELKEKTTIIKCMNLLSENKLKTVNALKKWVKYNLSRDSKFVSKKEYLILKNMIRAK